MRNYRLVVSAALTSAIAMLALAMASAASPADSERSLHGVVLHGSRFLAGARLCLQTNNGKILGHGKTDAKGRFSFDPVSSGSYLIVANKPGFQTAVVTVTVPASGAIPISMSSDGPFDAATEPAM